MWQALIGPVVSLVKDYFTHKTEEKRAIHERKIAIIQEDANWEARMADASSSSWKDEFWSIILSIPVLAVGVGVAIDDVTVIERVQRGLDTLSELPEWYQYLLFVAVCASFGIKGVDRLLERKRAE